MCVYESQCIKCIGFLSCTLFVSLAVLLSVSPEFLISAPFCYMQFHTLSLVNSRIDQSEWEEETAVNGEAGEKAPNHSLGWMFPRGLHRLTSLPSNSRHPPQPLPTHVYSQQLGLLVQKFALHPCPMPVSLKRRREVGPSGVDRGMLWRGKSSPS